MSEYDTNPERPPVTPGTGSQESPSGPEELPRAQAAGSAPAGEPPREQYPPSGQPVAGSAAGSGPPAGGQPAPEQPTAQGGSTTPEQPAAEQSAAGGPTDERPTAPLPSHPGAPHAGHAPPSYPYTAQSGWAGATGHTAAQPGGAYAQQYPYGQQPGQYGQQPGQHPYGQYPYPGQPQYGGQAPAWAQQPGTGRQPGSNRVGRIVAAGAAAVVLAVGSGFAGAWAALGLNDESTVSQSTASSGPAAPVIDRSSLASIAAAVEPSVVSISTQTGEGSGVVMTQDGYILTNNHVVASASGDTVRVVLDTGKAVTAKIVGTDPATDLAVIKAEGVSGLTPAKIGDSSAMRIGDTVLALGSPLGLQGSVTAGIISAKDRTIQVGSEQNSPFSSGGRVTSMSGMLQTDAPINPGNSGGALVNTNAEVIGINSAIATAGQSSGNIGVGFAIPSNKAKSVYDALVKGQKVSHPFLGVSVTTAPNGGALIGQVESGSPADRAGLQRGDVVTKLGDRQINTSDDLVSAVQSAKVGDKLPLTYQRNGSQQTTTVTLGEAS